MSGMIGLDETLKELRTQCPKLKDVMKAENLVYAATAGSVLLNEMENGLTATGVGAKVVELTSFASNAKNNFTNFIVKPKA